MTPCEIEPATFRFVAQYLNHCATAVPKLALVFPTKCGWWLNVDLAFCHSFTQVNFFMTFADLSFVVNK
jgi:hypothetical protein